ncbi:adaptor protein complex 1 mu subunit [Anaeramoeba ignava]|uniref:Adaptor protein complex 1 mu subunit n=1 Tax=Anaeramoeba ignava TaxID=1746090 RepID=A0A9Q0LLP8_ANAIG|nr:adaptor protein complex 1 mu subunit [Anaeramoeba ignava]|eukprot:Anaeramoba_ignava/a6738_56.p1 GENE.a6738_56~~a6738_56.p1  ORF type:complete len:427 (+),score=109.51 a6738_56:46-1326(+)
MACSSIFIFDSKGKALITRNYRNDTFLGQAKRYISHLLEQAEENEKCPISEEKDGVTFIYVEHNSLYFVAATRYNTNAAIVVEFLYSIIKVFQDYFKEVEEESISDNFVLIHQLLDEMMDFGYPQFSEAKVLQEYIVSETHKLVTSENTSVPIAVTGQVSWRKEGISHKKNQVYIDVIEKIKMTISEHNRVLNSEIIGSIMLNTELTGTPHCHLGLNDKIRLEKKSSSKKLKSSQMDDIKFHQCVRLSKFDSDRSITFIPPDGPFELLSYRVSRITKPLFTIESMIERHPGSRIEYLLKVKSLFRSNATATNVHVFIPVNENADSPKIKSSSGKCKYEPQSNQMNWWFKNFEGGKEHTMRAHFGLSSFDRKEADKRPITISFEIPYETVTGIRVKFLKIQEKSGYTALPWIRYLVIGEPGAYEIRI